VIVRSTPTFAGFSGLSSDQIYRLDNVVSAAYAGWRQAEAYLAKMSPIWSTLIGASSSYEAAKSDVYASKRLYEVLVEKRDRLVANPDSTEADVVEMEGAKSAVGNTALAEASGLLNPGGALREVGAGFTLPAIFGTLPWWVWAAGGVTLLVVLRPYIGAFSRKGR